MKTLCLCDKLGSMKIKFISELISVVTIGAFVGLWSNGSHQKWHRLGREAFLTHESQNFDKMYANPSSLLHSILLWVILTLSVFVFYKAVAFIAAKILSAFASKEEKIQG
jgi:hypothetical protein